MLENPNPQVTVQPQTSQIPLEPVTPISSKPPYLPLGLAVVVLVIAFGTGGYYLGSTKNQQPILPTSKETSTVLASPIATTESMPSPVTTQEPTNTVYSYKSFSFTYPKDWTVYDTTTKPTFFTQNRLDSFERGIVVEKGNHLLFIGIDPSTKGGASGGIFTSSSELSEWKSRRDMLTIGNGTYYLWKGQTPLYALTDPGTHSGIFGAASMSEFVANKVTNEQNTTYDGYEDYIQNKNGYSYLFVKLTRETSEATETPQSVQQELVSILKTITW